MSEKTILTLAIIFIFGAPLYQFGYITLSDISIFGFSLATLLMSISSLLDNPIKNDEEQHSIRKILKGATFILSLFLIILSLMVKENLPYISKIVNSIEPNVFLLFSIGIAFFTLFLSDIYKKQFFKKIDNEKNKAVTQALNQYDSQLKEIEKKLTKK
ncbi:hypothetical protein [Bacillus mycoides]|uniref:hypothetical protein n=1 Tax=Bacillus mycoides TaxID=1405 RepID=UPI0010BF2295|nr:hypothetical protein [Bacillus mycoides]TKI43298.1 hypothetical protein FC700_12375 [Bacillus mycoides]